jgi:hypothetical protein
MDVTLQQLLSSLVETRLPKKKTKRIPKKSRSKQNIFPYTAQDIQAVIDSLQKIHQASVYDRDDQIPETVQNPVPNSEISN